MERLIYFATVLQYLASIRITAKMNQKKWHMKIVNKLLVNSINFFLSKVYQETEETILQNLKKQ